MIYTIFGMNPTNEEIENGAKPIPFMRLGYYEKQGCFEKDGWFQKLYTMEYENQEENQSDEVILEYLFHKFNVERPEDFRYHSLSVSDIVCLRDDSNQEPRYYFCDSYDWKRIEVK